MKKSILFICALLLVFSVVGKSKDDLSDVVFDDPKMTEAQKVKDSEPGKESPQESNRIPQDTENWDIEALDTARDVDYLSDIEKDVILETNKARSDPKKYAELYIVPFGKRINRNGVYERGNDLVQTYEGVYAVNECIKVMLAKKPCDILVPEKGLSLPAQSHAREQAKRSTTGHTSADGSSPFTRIKKYGSYQRAGENISYGVKTGREIVIQLLVDDGVKSRGHRKNIFNPYFGQVGCGYATGHRQYGFVCVIDYAAKFIER